MQNIHITTEVFQKMNDEETQICNYCIFVSLWTSKRKKVQEEIVQEVRRGFIKKTLGVSALVAVGGVTAIASDKGDKARVSNGVVVGKSKKKEILYKRTAQWDAFYNAAY
jgi:hypothetical protein